MRQDTRRPGPDTPLGPRFGKVRTPLRIFMLLLIGMLLLSDLHLPWKLIPLAVAIAAVVVGIITLIRAVRAKLPTLLIVTTSAGIAVATFFAVGLLAQVALWPFTETYETCMSGALTDKAKRECTHNYFEDVSRLTQRP